MIEYIAILCDEIGDDFRVVIEIPDRYYRDYLDLVENVTKYVRELYPESSIVYIMPKDYNHETLQSNT